MRIIKFRGKDINGKWNYGDLLNMTEKDEETGKLIKGCAIVSLGINETIEEPREGVAVEIYKSEIAIVAPFTVGQFTGLTDKNGVEIYEGDILRKIHVYFFIEFSNGVFRYRELGSMKSNNICIAVDIYDVNSFEIVGNIHDK